MFILPGREVVFEVKAPKDLFRLNQTALEIKCAEGEKPLVATFRLNP